MISAASSNNNIQQVDSILMVYWLYCTAISLPDCWFSAPNTLTTSTCPEKPGSRRIRSLEVNSAFIQT